MTSIIFTGDIGFDRYMEGRFQDEAFLSKEVVDFFHSADHVVANVEGAMTHAKGDGSKVLFFHTMDPNADVFLNQIHADIWDIANNHCMDAGAVGMRDTKAVAAKNHATTIGAGENELDAANVAYLPEEGGIGIFACGYDPGCELASETEPGVLSWDAFETIEKTVKKIKETCRYCILVVHGGEEFAAMPMPYIRERYYRYLSMGVDIVVAHHPHVAQNYELTEDGKAIFYSLGNFVFDTDYQRAQFNTDRGVLLKLNLAEDGFTFEPFGTKIIRGEQRIEAGPVPAIFTDISAENYDAMLPLSARAFLSNERRRMVFKNPKEFSDAGEMDWFTYFTKHPEGYVAWSHQCYEVYQFEGSKKGNADAMPKVRDYLEAML